MHQSKNVGMNRCVRQDACSRRPGHPTKQHTQAEQKSVIVIGQTQDRSFRGCKKCVCLAAVQARRLKL